MLSHLEGLDDDCRVGLVDSSVSESRACESAMQNHLNGGEEWKRENDVAVVVAKKGRADRSEVNYASEGLRAILRFAGCAATVGWVGWGQMGVTLVVGPAASSVALAGCAFVVSVGWLLLQPNQWCNPREGQSVVEIRVGGGCFWCARAKGWRCCAAYCKWKIRRNGPCGAKPTKAKTAGRRCRSFGVRRGGVWGRRVLLLCVPVA